MKKLILGLLLFLLTSTANALAIAVGAGKIDFVEFRHDSAIQASLMALAAPSFAGITEVK